MRRELACVLGLMALACGGQTDGTQPSTAGTAGSGGSGGGPVWVPPIGDYCFGRGTRIATPFGSVAIEDLQVGDRVQAFDLQAQRVVTEHVNAVFVHEPQQVGLLRTAFGALRVTPNHPIYDAARRSFVAAGSLPESFETLELASDWSIAPATLHAFEPLTESETVYNLAVANVQTYFAEGVLVHNKSRCGYPGDPPDCPCLPDECPPLPVGMGGANNGAGGLGTGATSGAGASNAGGESLAGVGGESGAGEGGAGGAP